jgi:hypothetical protein
VQVLVQLQQEGIPSPNTRPVSSAWSGLTTAAAGPGSSASNSASTTPRGRLPQQAQYTALQQLSASSSPLFSALARRLSPPPVLNAHTSIATNTAANTTANSNSNSSSNGAAGALSEEQQSPVANTAAAAAAAIVAQLSPRWRSLAAAARMPGFGRPQPLDIPTAFEAAAGVTAADSSTSTTAASAATAAAVTANADSETSVNNSAAVKDSNNSNSADKSEQQQQQEVQELEVEIPRGHTAPPYGGVTGGSKQPGSPSASSPRMSAGMLCTVGVHFILYQLQFLQEIQEHCDVISEGYVFAAEYVWRRLICLVLHCTTPSSL